MNEEEVIHMAAGKNITFSPEAAEAMVLLPVQLQIGILCQVPANAYISELWAKDQFAKVTAQLNLTIPPDKVDLVLDEPRETVLPNQAVPYMQITQECPIEDE